MLLTIHLSESESTQYYTRKGELRACALRLARLRNRRFVQLVSVTGQILAVLEAA